MNNNSPYIFNVPDDQKEDSVKLWEGPISIPTYNHAEPDKNPMFFEKRVYQGSSGKVYPLPYVDKISDTKEDKEYTGVFLENDYVRFIILPELGGRIQIGQDKTNGNYDFFYRNDVIKPALVGLGGPWISGGVEFNWPQHHRPATYMPVQFTLETEDDGSKTVWLSDHDPKDRMKALLGLSLKPDSSVLEAKVRLYNRTEETKTFLWWANVAAEVHDQYQSFFPPDVNYVADHAARAMTEFPESKSVYYGIDYAPGKDISMYKNIPVPTSYMVVETEGEFFGGYDYKMNGGFVHVANKHISPGKKQWTWGNAEFGQSWDRNLTDENGPYVELMAGVYTNNQPDFTYLSPGETKEFSQFWYPIQDIGSAQFADTKGALHMDCRDEIINLGVCTTSLEEDCKISLSSGKDIIFQATADIAPGESFIKKVKYSGSTENLVLSVISKNKTVNMSYRYMTKEPIFELPQAAQEIPDPSEIDTIEELYLAGEHLDLYRHPTRYPEDYWLEAIKRDPGDVRSNTALGNLYLKRFDYIKAENHFREAIKRLTTKHPNPVDGESYYGLGLTLKRQYRYGEAYAAFYKSTWNFAWRASAYYELGLLDLKTGNLSEAEKHLKIAINHNYENLKARAFLASIYRLTGKEDKAHKICTEILDTDPLFYLAHNELINVLKEMGKYVEAEQQTFKFLKTMNDDEIHYIDTASDYLAAGLNKEAESLVQLLIERKMEKCSPCPLYVMAWIKKEMGVEYTQELDKAATWNQDYFFPSTPLEFQVLLWASAENRKDFNAPYSLGTMLYDKKEKRRAITHWELAESRGSSLSTLYRNLGIAFFNYKKDVDKALSYYEKAFELAQDDGRILFELDQLKKKNNISLELRKEFILKFPEHIDNRDDLGIEVANLYSLTGEPEKAISLLESRQFHPWEGGEGQVVNAWTTAHLLMGKVSEGNKNFKNAIKHYNSILEIPLNLGETWHPLQNQAQIYYRLGLVYEMMGDKSKSVEYFEKSKMERGDFSGMAVQPISENTYFTAKSIYELGEKEQAKELFNKMVEYGKNKLEQVAKIDYFATSLPLLLVFDDDTQLRSDLTAKSIMAMGYAGLENVEMFSTLKDEILNADICNPIQYVSVNTEMFSVSGMK